jgi:prevent-host-death family protein
MQSISISKLRVNLTSILEDVKKGETIIVTSYGNPVAWITPPQANRRTEAIAKLEALRKNVFIGDVVSPTGEIWEAS